LPHVKDDVMCGIIVQAPNYRHVTFGNASEGVDVRQAAEGHEQVRGVHIHTIKTFNGPSCRSRTRMYPETSRCSHAAYYHINDPQGPPRNKERHADRQNAQSMYPLNAGEGL
jgi:hypothetical protein